MAGNVSMIQDCLDRLVAHRESGSCRKIVSGNLRMTMVHSQVVLQKVPLRMSRVDAPPVVDKHVEDAQERDEETGTPLGLESDGYHDTRAESDNRDEHSGNGPVALEDEADEEEDEEDSAGELEAARLAQVDPIRERAGQGGAADSLLAPVGLAQRRQTRKELLLVG